MITLLFIIVGLILVYLSPLDYQQGLTVKIMYIHVPSAWLALLTYAIMTIYSIIGLAFKIPFSFVINKAIAPIGAIFTLLCLISGSMWGKPMWGTWWVWDARLTSVAILFIFYLLIIFLNQTFENSSKRIEDYNKSLESLLEETKNTYREVNHSLRDNAEYIKNELK